MFIHTQTLSETTAARMKKPKLPPFSDEIRCAIGKRKLRCFLDVDVAGRSVSQKFIRVT